MAAGYPLAEPAPGPDPRRLRRRGARGASAARSRPARDGPGGHPDDRWAKASASSRAQSPSSPARSRAGPTRRPERSARGPSPTSTTSSTSASGPCRRRLIWAGEGRGFVVEPLHRGFVFNNPVSCSRSRTARSAASPTTATVSSSAGSTSPRTLGDIGFSGVPPLHQPTATASRSSSRSFRARRFFRALARGQNFGVVARALTLRPAETRGEEIPFFRAFWIERPTPGTTRSSIHGLIDSESIDRRRAHDLPARRDDDHRCRDDAVPARQSRACRPRRHGLDLPVRPERPAQRRRRSRPAVYESEGPADAQRSGRVALAPAPQSGDPADLGLRRHAIRAASA